MNNLPNNHELQPQTLNTKGAPTMKNNTLNRTLTITAFASMILLFGACSQPTIEMTDQPTAAITKPDVNAATDVTVDSSADTTASAEDLKDIAAIDASTDVSSSLQVQGGDKVPPVLTYTYAYPYANYFYLYLQFSEYMNHDSVCKKAIKVVVVPPSGPAFNAKGKCYWYSSGSIEYVYWVPNKVLAKYSQLNWKVTRDAKDKAGNKLFAGKNGTVSLY